MRERIEWELVEREGISLFSLGQKFPNLLFSSSDGFFRVWFFAITSSTLFLSHFFLNFFFMAMFSNLLFSLFRFFFCEFCICVSWIRLLMLKDSILISEMFEILDVRIHLRKISPFCLSFLVLGSFGQLMREFLTWFVKLSVFFTWFRSCLAVTENLIVFHFYVLRVGRFEQSRALYPVWIFAKPSADKLSLLENQGSFVWIAWVNCKL